MTNLKTKKLFTCKLIITVALFAVASPALAVDVFLFSGSKELASDQFVVSLGVDTGADKINAV